MHLKGRMPEAKDWIFGGIDENKNVFLRSVSDRKVGSQVALLWNHKPIIVSMHLGSHLEILH